MASEQIVYHIDEQFCQCAICFKPFSEPKSLPCLHRFCKECLRPLFVTLNAGDIFPCPLCRAELTVTEGGVEDMKSDFLVSELTKVIQLQKNLQTQNQIRRCEGCGKEEESIGFCSKCGGFLCQNCFNLHQTLKTAMLKDHQPVIDLKDVFSGKVKIGIEKLSQFSKAPKCENHPENILRLSCVTCQGQQICMACTYEDHVDHKAESIRNIAKKQGEDLQKKLDELRPMVTGWENNYNKLTTVQEKVSSVVEVITTSIRRFTEGKLEQLKEERENNQLCTEAKINELRNSIVFQKVRLENEKNEKIKEIERQYDENMKKHETDTNNNIGKIREDSNKRSDEIEKQTAQLKAHCDEMINAVTNQLQQQNLELERLTSDLLNAQKRFENFISTGTSVLSLANDWSAVENIPSISLAFDGIKNDIGKIKARLCKFKDGSKLSIPKLIRSNKLEKVGFIERLEYLESETDIGKSDIPLDLVDKVVFLKSSGCIVLSGNLKSKHSAAVNKVAVTSDKQECIKSFNECSMRYPYCLICCMEEDTIAIACDIYLGILNVKEPTYNQVKFMGEGSFVCVCSDQAVRQIFTYQVEDTVIKVFDLNLKLVKTRKPPIFPCYTGIVAHDGKLIISKENSMYVVSENDEVLCRIPPPSLPREEEEVWRLRDFCCAGDGTLHAHWRKSLNSEHKEFPSGCIVVYTPSYYPFEMIPISGKVTCFDLIEKDEKRKMIAASADSLFIYKTGPFY